MIIINIQQTANKIETRIVSSDKLNSQNMSYVYIDSDNQIYVREGILQNDIDILSAVLMQRKVDSRIKKTYFDIVDSLKTNQVSKNQFESLYKMVLVKYYGMKKVHCSFRILQDQLLFLYMNSLIVQSILNNIDYHD